MYMHAPNQERQTTPVVQSSSTRPDLAGGRSGGQTCNEYAAGELGSATLIATVLVQTAAVSDRPFPTCRLGLFLLRRRSFARMAFSYLLKSHTEKGSTRFSKLIVHDTTSYPQVLKTLYSHSDLARVPAAYTSHANPVRPRPCRYSGTTPCALEGGKTKTTHIFF
jgi:hypothetical protein